MRFSALRKVLPLLVLFVAGAFLGKPLALGGIGLCTKIYLFFESGYHFSYRSVDWHQGSILFSEVDVTEPRAFRLHAKQITLSLTDKHLSIERPYVNLYGTPRAQGQSQWTCVMTEGIISLEGIGESSFTFMRSWPHHLGHLVIEKGSSLLNLEARQEGTEVWVDADVSHFDLTMLRPWIDLKGQIDGRIHLVFDANRCERGSASVRVHQGGYREIVKEVEGSLDWEGVIQSGSILERLQQSRIYIGLLDGSIRGTEALIEHVRGTIVLTPELGMKWSLDGAGRSKQGEYPLSWTGKSLISHWLESEIQCLDSRLSLKGREEEGDFVWEGECQHLSSVEGDLLASLYSLFLGREAQWGGWVGGAINATVKCLYSQGKVIEWGGSALLDHFLYQIRGMEIGCTAGEMKFSSRDLTGEFSLDGASFSFPLLQGKKIMGKEWSGWGSIEKGSLVASHLAGKVGEGEIGVEALGSLDDFSICAEGDRTALRLQGGWDGGRCKYAVKEGKLSDLVFCSSGWIDLEGGFEVEVNRFEGALSPLYRLCGGEGDLSGRILSIGEGFKASQGTGGCEWALQARALLSNGMGIYCPVLEKKGDAIVFDVHVESALWDVARLSGIFKEGQVCFNGDRSHFLGRPLLVHSCVWNGEGLTALQGEVVVDWQTVFCAAAPLFPEVREWDECPLQGQACLQVAFDKRAGFSLALDGTDASWRGKPIPLKLSIKEGSDNWLIFAFQMDMLSLSCHARRSEGRIQFTQGLGQWGTGIEGAFEGAIEESLQCHVQFSQVTCDLSTLGEVFTAAEAPFQEIQGIWEGTCHLAWTGKLEADFTMHAPTFRMNSLDLENKGPLHIAYSSESGISVSGIDVQAQRHGELLGSAQIGLLQRDTRKSVWSVTQAHLQLLSAFWDLFPQRPEFLQGIDTTRLLADCETPCDFSSFSWRTHEISVPLGKAMYQIRNFSLFFDSSGGRADFEYLHQGRFVKVHLGAIFGSDLLGKLILEEAESPLEVLPLTLDWIYNEKRGLCIRAIEGCFGGIDASFHAIDSEHTLIGSARLNCHSLAHIVPSSLAELFHDLKMGEGYEIKGCLSIAKGEMSFRGLLSGKQVELFGYQFRTLLAQIEWHQEGVRISDLKVSDSAGMLKIEELIAAGLEGAPWTISIPRLTISELRPSLLKRVGAELGAPSPLVIREIKMENFQGVLEESQTYTARGEISFINSYRREHTVFDIPSDFLGRIVGLDLELLIPVCGTFHYELKDRSFFLTELTHAYSEAKRSEFFFIQDPAPQMDLDGGLHILVKMKQFVLFKFTESFLISIEGTLNDPQFHLQKKRRFLRPLETLFDAS